MVLRRNTVYIAFSWVFVVFAYVMCQGWEPYETWFMHNSDYLLQQVIALEHPEMFRGDIVYSDPKYITWNPQGLIWLTRMAYKVTGTPFLALKCISIVLCLSFGIGFFILFRRLTQSDYWAFLLSASLVVFYDFLWGNGFGVPYMDNVWARALFRAELGWLIYWFLIVAKGHRSLPLFGLCLGLSAALVHPKPGLAWGMTFFMTLLFVQLRQTGFNVSEYLRSVQFKMYLLAGVLFSVCLLVWLALSLKMFTSTDPIAAEVTQAVMDDRAANQWYVWEILPEMFNRLKMQGSLLAVLTLVGWCVWGQLYARRNAVDDIDDVNVLRIAFVSFLFVTIGVPLIEFLLIWQIGFVAQLSALSVNLASLRMWLLLLGCTGVAGWTATGSGSRRGRWRVAVASGLLLIASATTDVGAARTWFANSYKYLAYSFVESFELQDTVQKWLGRNPAVYLTGKRNFQNALAAAAKTPVGSLFYCYNGANFVRSGAIRPMVFSYDDKQKCIVSEETRPKYLEILKIEKYLESNRPEVMALADALKVYRALGAEFVLDKRVWPEPGDDAKYSVFYRNDEWSIIRILP